MNKIFFLSAILVTLFFSCKKDDTDIPIGTIKVDINGSSYTFNLQAKATTLTVTGGYGIQIQGYYRNGSTTNLRFSIARPGAISTGTYTENAASNPLVLMTHCTEVIAPCVIRANAYGSTSNPVSITITEITGSSVKGTFKGDLQVSTGTTEVLSNGVFHVSF